VGVVICVAVFALAVFTQLSPVWLVIAAALAGISVRKLREGRG